MTITTDRDIAEKTIRSNEGIANRNASINLVEKQITIAEEALAKMKKIKEEIYDIIRSVDGEFNQLKSSKKDFGDLNAKLNLAKGKIFEFYNSWCWTRLHFTKAGGTFGNAFEEIDRDIWELIGEQCFAFLDKAIYLENPIVVIGDSPHPEVGDLFEIILLRKNTFAEKLKQKKIFGEIALDQLQDISSKTFDLLFAYRNKLITDLAASRSPIT